MATNPKFAGILKDLHKKYGKDSAMILSEGNPSEVNEVVSTGIDLIDHHIIGVGGIPVGRMGEISGLSGSGKTSLGFSIIANFQKAGGTTILVETEDALQVDRAALFGVDLGNILLLSPGSMEDAIDQIASVLGSLTEGPNLVVWDSIAATLTNREVQGEAGDSMLAEKPRVLSRNLPKLTSLLPKSRTALVLINQVRANIGGYGSATSTPGGNAIKFYASWRLDLSAGTKKKKGDTIVAQDSLVKCTKNKLAFPFRQGRVRLNFDTGFDNGWSNMNFAKDSKLIPANAKDIASHHLAAARALATYDEKLNPKPWPLNIPEELVNTVEDSEETVEE